MAFTVTYENNELPKDCFKCPMSSFVSSDCLYCPPQGAYVHPQKDKRPESCTIKETIDE